MAPPARTKVSVVVPVYNPGSFIDPCIESLMGQSLSADEYEVIFVDDGSTDGTGEKLDRLADSHPNVVALHIPNSGWPGKPRNVGIDAAHGEFVYFVDNDDWLEPEALQRLYERAVSADADIVVGKVVGHGKGVPPHVFRRNRDGVTLDSDAPLLGLLTPHKLFRRSLLDSHQIRFPEGRRRLEDHVFVLKAYFVAQRISILADYPCYHWVVRPDQSNASRQRLDPYEYYSDVADLLDLVDAHVPPGPLRDRLYRHWYQGKMLARVGGQHFLELPRDYRERLVDAVGTLARSRMWDGLLLPLNVNRRLRARLLHANRLDLLLELAEAEKGLRLDAATHHANWEGEELSLDVSCHLRYADGRPMTYRRDGDRLFWNPPMDVRDVPVTAEDLDVTGEIRRMDIVLQHTHLQTEYLVPVRRPNVTEHPIGQYVWLEFRGNVTIDVASAAAGSRLPAGMWNVWGRLSMTGVRAEADLPGSQRSGRLPARVRRVLARATRHRVAGGLRLEVGPRSARLRGLR